MGSTNPSLRTGIKQPTNVVSGSPLRLTLPTNLFCLQAVLTSKNESKQIMIKIQVPIVELLLSSRRFTETLGFLFCCTGGFCVGLVEVLWEVEGPLLVLPVTWGFQLGIFLVKALSLFCSSTSLSISSQRQFELGGTTISEAEAVATTCYTQNCSIVRLRHGKTPYELLHDKPPNLSFFHVFSALCYPTNDSKNLDFDELAAMASEHSSSGLALHEITPATISSGLVPNPPPSTPFVPPSRSDWDLLFQLLFDELLTSPPSVDYSAPEVVAPIHEVVAPVPTVSTGSPSLTNVGQDAPSPSNSQTTLETQPPVIPNDVKEDNHDIEVAHMGNDPYFGIPIPEVHSDQSSSSDIIYTIVLPDNQIYEHNSKWTKDHPLENIIGELDRPVSIRL
ncbi:hypothetical protein Tco_1282263 [Tanacetum coccineum]